jgi:ferric-dicitrate binding protein FerR (iron transport regulator)
MPDPSISLDDSQFLARAFAGELTPDEAAALRRWLAEDPSRRWAFEQLRRAWVDAGRVRQVWDAEGALATIKARAANERASDANTAVAPLTASASRWRAAGKAVLRTAAWGVAATVAVAVGVRELVQDHAAAPTPEPIVFREVSTRRGETAQLRFADGTEIRLAPTSRLRYPADMLGPSRDLELDGEAYVVAGHPGGVRAPLQIRTALGTTRDIGTRFVVRALPDAPLEVVVVDGLVSLHAAVASDSAADDSLVIPPGSLGTVTTSGALRAPRRVRVDAYVSWLDGRLSFVDTPVRDVLATLARWRSFDYTIADPAVGHRRFTGVVDRERTSEFLDVVALTANLRLEWRGDSVVVRDDTSRVTAPRAPAIR